MDKDLTNASDGIPVLIRSHLCPPFALLAILPLPTGEGGPATPVAAANEPAYIKAGFVGSIARERTASPKATFTAGLRAIQLSPPSVLLEMLPLLPTA